MKPKRSRKQKRKSNKQMTDFILPVQQDYSTPTYSPYDFVHLKKGTLRESFERVFGLAGFYSDWKDWKIPRDKVVQHISKNVLDKNGHLPIGTLLYHGSLDPNLTFTEDYYTFFGIDAIISIWYILELNERRSTFFKKQKPGYLYVFEVVKPIEDVFIIPKLNDHPHRHKKCKKSPCIHPQIAFHGFDNDAYELSIEFTFNVKRNPGYLQLKHVFAVDIEQLKKNRKKTLNEFNPIEALS